MKEAYLQYIWSTKNIPFHRLTTVNGEAIEIKYPGILNHDSGPDFFNGIVKIGEITWAGNIEIHVKSSDWYAHRHETDAAYDNVILHIVYQYDKPVYIAGKELPTIELKHHIQARHYQHYLSFFSNQSRINCAQQLHTVPSFFVIQQLENALIERLERRSDEITQRFELLKQHKLQLMFERIAMTFGLSVNVQPFFELTSHLSIQSLMNQSESNNFVTLLGTAGLIDEKHPLFSAWDFIQHKLQLTPLHPSQWKYKGVRPPSYPEKRIYELAQLVSSPLFQQDLFELSSTQLLQVIARSTSNLSEEMRKRLIINGIAPLVWWYGNYTQTYAPKQRALDLLKSLPNEQNIIISSWKKLKVTCKTAADSQALIETHNQYCKFNKCLQCKIGLEILKK